MAYTYAARLVLVGIYGVLSLSVNSRQREIGIRIAIGAQRNNVLGVVLSEGLRLIVQLTPLYQGVDLLRSLAVGVVGPEALFHVVYLLLMGFAGLFVVSRRLDRLLLK